MGRLPGRIAGAVGGARPAALCCWLLVGAPAAAQPTLNAAELDTASLYLRRALAGPREGAYLQILTEAVVVPDPADTTGVHDLIARYDPDRYRSPYAGLYPLTFEEQFIQWGKRIALFTRSVRWQTGRFYLHDTASGQQAWVFTDEARRLYPPVPMTFPGPVATDAGTGQSQWLKLIHGTGGGTGLEGMGLWLRLMRRESREAVLLRAAKAPAPAGGG